MRKVGCLVALLLLAAAAYLTRGWWMPKRVGNDAAVAARDSAWEPLTPEGAIRAKQQVESLGQRTGPVFANVRAGDLASYIFASLAKQLPPTTQADVRAAVLGDRFYVKAPVNLRDLGGAGALGPLAGMLADRDTMQLGGQFELVHAGLAQFHVLEIKLHDFSMPKKMIPRLLTQVERGSRPAGVADDALPLVVPAYIGDVRASQGHLTIYKTTP